MAKSSFLNQGKSLVLAIFTVITTQKRTIRDFETFSKIKLQIEQKKERPC